MNAFLVIVAIVGAQAAPSIDPTTAVPQLLVNGVPQNYANFTGPIAIVSQSDYQSPDGSFNYSYVTANGINQNSYGYIKKIIVPIFDANGTLTNQTHEEDVLVQHGSYSYFAPDGEYINVNYIADENGFQAFGDNLPTPPPIPADIMASLQVQALKNGQAVEPIPNGAASVPVPSTVALQTPAIAIATTTTVVPTTTPKPATTTTSESTTVAGSTTVEAAN